MAVRDPSSFLGNDRFRIQRRLGEGSVGVVYQARDLDTRQDVALKTLRKVDPLSLFRFKQEFRALADVRHENLARLYELTVEKEVWFFTMELVFGDDFHRYISAALPEAEREAAHSASSARTLRSTQVLTIDVHGVANEGPDLPALPPTRRRPLDFDRLRHALRQLVEGLLALHAAGKLHRDVKPSNVLVTEEDRVVLLDFGLVTELDPGGFELGGRRRVCGTAGYMSPEQSAAESISAASDWYAVGVILYEALTGTLPFIGTVEQVLADKRAYEPLPPRALIAGVPEDLDLLCEDLLRLDPSARPEGSTILQRLGGRAKRHRRYSPPTFAAPIVGGGGPFVGRTRQLSQLEHAFSTAQHGRAVTMLVSGPTGIGKTVVTRKFVEALEKEERAFVLAGRCYERESVPYKALDPLMDALCHRLMMMTDDELAEVLPAEAPMIARLFPVLERVQRIGDQSQRNVLFEPHALRKRAFAALKDLFFNLSQSRPVVLFIDDLQWGDDDSAQFLASLLEPPNPPPVLLITCHRSEDDEAPVVQRLREIEAELRELEVGALDAEESETLARQLLAENAGGWQTSEENAAAIAAESGGNPFFISELAHFAKSKPRTERKPLRVEAVSLDRVLDERIQDLAGPERQLLEVVAVAGRPVPQSIVLHAAGVEAGERSLDGLRHRHLVRTRGARGADLIEAYHDRIRERAISHLHPQRIQRLHARLAQAFESLAPGDPESLAMHYAGAGKKQRAARAAAKAAELAFNALAFDRAAELYRRGIHLAPDDASVSRWFARLGDALANAGRGADAANAYLEAAKGAPDAVAIERKRRAAEQYLRSGHVDEGVQVLEEVTDAVSVRAPKTSKRALASVLMRRARLAVRGQGFTERAVTDVPADDLARIDVCWSGALGLGMIDVIRSVDFQTAHFLYALDAGEPYRVARAFAGEALTVATAGGAARDKARRLIARAEEIATRIDHPHALGMAALAAGMAENLVGHWKNARRHHLRAERLFVERCTGAAWETATAQHMSLWALVYLGGMKELVREVPARLRDARRRGDLYAATQLATGLPNLAWVVKDDVDGARAVLAEAMGRWSTRGFHLQHYNDLLAEVHLDLYAGRAETAVRRLKSKWSALEGSLLLRVQQIRIEALHLYGRAKLHAAAVDSAQGAEALSFVEKSARAISKEKVAWAHPLARLLLAGRAELMGKNEQAIGLYQSAARELDDVDMALYAHAARLRQGELTGGEEGQTLVDQSMTWMMEEGIRDPARFAAMLVPARSASS